MIPSFNPLSLLAQLPKRLPSLPSLPSHSSSSASPQSPQSSQSPEPSRSPGPLSGLLQALPMLPVAVVANVVNHLLAAEPWATRKLVPHAGKIVNFDAGPTALRLQVGADGAILAAPADRPASVTIRVKLSDLPLIAQNRERAFSYVKIEGDADFANTISQLSQSVRWDAQADIARVVGDIAAVRIVDGARKVHGATLAGGRSLAENLAEYFLDEQPALVRPAAVAEWTAEIARLRDDSERLTKRIDKLKGRFA